MNSIAVGSAKPVARISFWKAFEFPELVTVTPTAEERVEFPAASRARAASVCEPFEVFRVSHASAYGAIVSSPPVATPST